MKIKIIIFSFSLFFVVSNGFSQQKDGPKSIIREDASINKYHNKEELERMQKGELLNLYIERIKVLVKTLPYIAFATKPGITMSTLGIPNDKGNRRILDDEFEATDDYLNKTVEFQKQILPYSDTSNLIAAILFYEESLKALHEYSQYH